MHHWLSTWKSSASRGFERARNLLSTGDLNDPGRKRAFIILATTLVLSLVASAGIVAATEMSDRSDQDRSGDPPLSLKRLPPVPERSRILARDGTEIAVLFGDENRKTVELEEIAQIMADTTVAIEDRRFFTHPGVDAHGIVRALMANFDAGSIKQGGSTITQQYVRNVYLTQARSFDRKAREVGLALALERRHSKNQILEAYLNTAYFGDGAYGVEAASETYFGIQAKDLEPHQAALLVALLRSPSDYSPSSFPQIAKVRRDLVLDGMSHAKLISPHLLDGYKSEPLGTIPRKTIDAKMAPHFVEFVKQQLLDDKRLGRTPGQRYDAVFGGGLTIKTSLDPRIQQAADKATAKLPKGVPEAAVVVMDHANGDILGYHGGSSFNDRKFDLASQGQRQPGSAFKTFGLVAALRYRYSPDMRLSGRNPCTFKLSKYDTWKVNNYAKANYGSITLRDATAKSVNCAYANLVMKFIEPSNVVEAAKDMGITSPLQDNPAIVLGGLHKGVSPLEMTRAYGTLANDGKRVKIRPIIEVRDRTSGLVFKEKVESEQTLSKDIARMTTSVLKSVIKKGTGTRADIGWDQAGKTGTTQSNRDAWFVGYTPKMVAGVWIGHPDGQVEMSRVTGGSVPAKIWRDVMEEAHRGLEKETFAEPDEDGFTLTKSVRSPTPSKKRKRRAPPAPVPVESTAPEPTDAPPPPTETVPVPPVNDPPTGSPPEPP